jgi:hypothetical protein
MPGLKLNYLLQQTLHVGVQFPILSVLELEFKLRLLNKLL